MTWFFLCMMLSLAPALQAQDSLLVQQSRRQVRRYVKSVHQQKATDLNLWALAEVGRDQPEIRSYLTSYIARKEYESPGLKVFRDTTLSFSLQLKQLAFTAQSPFLLTTYLMAATDSTQKRSTAAQFGRQVGYPEGPVHYRKLVEALLQHEPITPAMLPADRFYPVHFLLFFNSDLIRNNIITTDYLQTAAKNWSQSSVHGNEGIETAIHRLTLFRTYYLLDQYTHIDPLYGYIINDSIFPNSPRKLHLLRMLDYSMYRLGYYNRSLHITRKYSLPFAYYFGQKETALKIQIAQGAYLYYIGKIEQAKAIYLQVQKAYKVQYHRVSQARIANNLATDYWKSGEYNRYLSLQFTALDQAKKEDNYDLRIIILRNLFIYYRVKKDFSSAQNYLSQAKALAKKEDNADDLAKLNFDEGILYWETASNFTRAIHSFNNALDILSPTNNYRSYQNIIAKKAQLLEKKGKYHRSQIIYQRMLKMNLQRNDGPNALQSSFNIANTYLQLNETDSAQAILDTLKTKNLAVLPFRELVNAKTVQARYLKKAGRPGDGARKLQPVITQILKRSRGSGDIETGFWQVEPEYLDAFELYANLLISTHQPDKAVEALDRLKTINDAGLYQNPLVRAKILNEKELSDYKRINNHLDELRKTVLAGNNNQQGKIQQQIDELSARKSALDRKINAGANTKPVPVSSIQRHMDAHQRVLHITELNDTYYVAVISRTSVHFSKIPITPKLKEQLEESIRRIREGTTDLQALYAFTKLLGIDKLPSYVTKLTIIPDSYLYQLPMDVLPVNPPETATSYGEAHYLIERFETNYMTSLNDFNQSSKTVKYTYSFAGYGVSKFDNERTALVPLPQAKAEIRSVSNQLSALKNKITFVNDSATVPAFRKTAPHARILHLATHSKVDNQNPMFSSIYLKESDETSPHRFSGRIFAYQFFELDLQNELVMLNSCESGSGAYLQGTGVVGISRALRYAGAESLVLNLWLVNDMMAADFATKFYNGINKGETKSKALQQTKLYFLKNSNANPHFWGTYMLLGNNSAIVDSHQWSNKIAGISFMLFFFSLTIASSFVEMRKRQKNNRSARET